MAKKHENHELYEEKLRYYQDEINHILEQEKAMEELAAKDPEGSIYKKIMLVDDLIYAITLHLAKYQIAAIHLRGKNEAILNEARKAVYKVIICLEDIVSNFIDVPFSDYEDKVQRIENVPQKHRFYLMRKLGLAIELVIRAYGDNTKWKWTFVEIQGRFATVAKNILDLKDSTATGFNPHSPDYESTMFHLKMVKRLLLQAADKYRARYEMSTSSIEDFRLAIQYLSAARRMHVLLNERNDAEEVKRQIDIWTDKMEKDLQRRKGK
jgi:hypothetical protein|nr:hypothetical protein [uncultured Treponema sp.]